MKSKYLVGKQFKSLRQLIKWCKKGKSVFFHCKCMNSAWVLNQQVSFLEHHLYCFSKTVRKGEK